MISIYNINGVVVSCLKLSQQKAGNYLVRDMAAYWDGRSMNGELVSSGGVLYVRYAQIIFQPREKWSLANNLNCHGGFWLRS